jgi:hypothetical protein
LLPLSDVALDDSEALSGAILFPNRQATVGDLRAGRAKDIYWAIEDPDSGVKAHWRTRTDVRFGPPDNEERREQTGTFTFSCVIHAETYGGVTRALATELFLSEHARRFRETLNGLSDKTVREPKERKTVREPAKQATEPKAKKSKQIDLVRTDGPVAWDLVAGETAMVPVSAALYVLLDHSASPALLTGPQQTYMVPMRALRFASYNKMRERIQAIEDQAIEETASSQGSVCS